MQDCFPTRASKNELDDLPLDMLKGTRSQYIHLFYQPCGFGRSTGARQLPFELKRTDPLAKKA